MEKNTAQPFDQTSLKFVIPIAVLVLLTAFSTPALANYNFDGFPLTTRTNGTVHGGVFIDYVPGAEDTQTGYFDVPNGNIKWAYLYTGIWGGTENYEGWVNVTFNGDYTSNNLGPIWIRGKNDTNPNVWGSGHGKHWMYYNVTDLTNAGSTNSATVSKINATDPGGNFDGDPYGIVLVVVYKGGDNPKDLRYWINDGSDGLNYITPHDAGTTYFNGAVDTANVTDANLTMVHLTAYAPPVDDGLKFNGHILNTSMIDTNAFDFHSWNVTSYMESLGNDAWYTRCGDYPTCTIPESDGYINICNAILVLDETPPPPPDLNVTAIEVNPDYDAGHRELFANESNTITAAITNLDLNNNSKAFNVSFEIEGVNTWKVSVSGLAAGASTDVSINWTPTRGGTVLSPVNYNLNVTADCDGEVSETNETNNASTKSLAVYNNGYKGKRYTGGSDIDTEQMETINGSLLYSIGNTTYQQGGEWSSYSVNWTSGDLPVPGGATVKKARLYVYYNWDSSAAGINANLTFNGYVYSMNDLDAHYKDAKGHGYYYDHKSGTMTYNVTDYFNVSGNTATLTKIVPNNIVAIYGMLLVVAYEDDENEPKRVVWINEECDILDAIGEGPDPGNIGVNETEATAYAPFTDVTDIHRITTATLITIAPAGDSGTGNEDRLYFNNGEWDNVWNGASGENISINETDVKGYLQSGSNLARMQSRGDYITATNAFLVVEYKPDAPDLVITDKWVCWPDNCTICYNVTNIGTITAAALHNTTLYVDENRAIINDTVPVNLLPGASYIGCFNYTWTYTPLQDNITVCTDSNNSVDEKSDEDNNCLTNEWKCGDVALPYGKITWTGDVMELAYYSLGAPGHTIKSEWAGDVAPPYGKITWTGDVMELAYYSLGAPGHEIHCCCEA
jgi:hypothetical protein